MVGNVDIITFSSKNFWFEKCFKSIGEKDVAKDFNQEIDN